jgi:isoleucyl-tRNA synthetase
VVVLDLEVTDELAAEGRARDLIRAVQQARRDAHFDVSDRIELRLGAELEVRVALERFSSFIAGETLAVDVAWVDPRADLQPVDLDGVQVGIGVLLARTA